MTTNGSPQRLHNEGAMKDANDFMDRLSRFCQEVGYHIEATADGGLIVINERGAPVVTHRYVWDDSGYRVGW